MSYIPKKLVNPGLYATGDNFLDESTGKVYTGPYHNNFNGDSFTGIDPYDPNKRPLIPNPSKSGNFPITKVVNTPQNRAYSDLNKKNDALLKYGNDPKSFTPQPTEQDYTRGSINRYFAKRITEKPPSIREISAQSYNSLNSKDGDYNYAIWRPYTVLWRISGPTEQQVSTTNQKTVDRANKDFRGIKTYLKNYTQYYKAPVDAPEASRTFRETPIRPRSGGGRRVLPEDEFNPRVRPPELY